MGFYEVNLVVWPQKPQKLLLFTEPCVLTEPSVKTEDQDFSAEDHCRSFCRTQLRFNTESHVIEVRTFILLQFMIMTAYMKRYN